MVGQNPAISNFKNPAIICSRLMWEVGVLMQSFTLEQGVYSSLVLHLVPVVHVSYLKDATDVQH